TASSGTRRGKATKAISAGSTRRTAQCSSGWRCRAAPSSAGSSPTAQISSMPAADRAEKSAPCAVRNERGSNHTFAAIEAKEHIMSTTIAGTRETNHPVVSKDQWIAERKKLLAREKELTHLRDQVARERRELPWVRVEKDYVFDTPAGRRSLAELFGGRRQLLVQHFMFGPGWEQGCKSCSFMADHTDAMNVHLAQRDVTMIAVSRAPLAEIERFRRRMGWQFEWVSSHGSDFNYDWNVSFTPAEKSGEVY